MAFKAKAKAPTPALTAQAKYERALERGIDLRRQDEEAAADELKRMANGERIEAEVAMLQTANRRAAQSLIDGETPSAPAKRESYQALLARRASIRLAIEMNNEKCEQARLAAAGERYAARLGDIASVGKRMAEAFFELEAAMRERDALARQIGLPAGSLWFEAWPVGRIANTGSLPYRFLEAAVTNGAITQRELDEAVSAARAAQR
jgi:hypothetical protein